MPSALLAFLLFAGTAPSAKIAPHLARALSAGSAEMIVVLREQADLAPARELPTKGAKGRFVFGALRDTAERSQAPLLAWLDERHLPYRSFAIVNAVWVKADAAAALEIAARPDVLRVEANPVVRGLLPEPPAAERGTLAPATVEPGVSGVNADTVWASGNHGEGIVIADADTGVRWTHAALVGKYRGTTGGPAVHDRNWHDSVHTGGGVCGANSPVPCDDNGHGTHTTGFAVGDDGVGNQVGTAPGAKWIACRNMDQGDGTPARYLECMEFFLAPYPVNGTPADGDPSLAPDVVNNSWGCPASEGCSVGTFETALAAQRAAGILYIVSAGNGGPSCSTVSDPPATSGSVFSVGALQTGTGNIASFSSLGPVTADGSNRSKPDAVAPGTGIRSSSSTSDTAYSSGSGTSYSGPLVAGVAALLLADQPALKHQPAQAHTILAQSAMTIDSSSCSPPSSRPNNVFGWGLVNAQLAVQLARSTPIITAVAPPSGPTAGGTTVTISGVHFQAGDTVTIGGITVTPTNVTPTSMDAVTPVHAAGPVDVTVTDPSMLTGTLQKGFSYCDGTNGCGIGPLLFYTLLPCRLVDTRNAAASLGGPALAPGAARTFRLEGTCGIPAGARALALNVTAVDPDASGHFKIYAAGLAPAQTSVVNFAPGAVRANFAIASVDPWGRLVVECDLVPGGTRADLLIDVTGFFR